MSITSTGLIEKKVLLHAPLPRVWQALTDPKEFGAWFRVKLEGPFVPGGRVLGKVTYPGYEHITMEVWVERMEPQSLFSFRWHPCAIDPDLDYAGELTTLVEFRLESVAGETLLRVVESGFDQLPEGRREEAFRMNDGGWAQQMGNIERHLGG